MKVKVSLGERIFNVCNYIILTFLALVCLYPFWHVVMASISDNSELVRHTGALLKPAGFSLEAYKRVLGIKSIWTGYKNTLFLLGVSVPLQVIMTALGAYFFSRKGVLFQKPLLFFCMFTMYFSGGTIPTYLNLKGFHLTGTLWGLILPVLLTTHNMIILRTSFNSIPESLYDAARIDGAGHLRVLFRIVLPLSKASVAVIAMYYGVGVWNAWFWSSMILRKEEQFPLQLVLRNMLITEDANALVDIQALETLKYATIVVAVLPMLLIYPILQKYFTKGVMVGAVKG